MSREGDSITALVKWLNDAELITREGLTLRILKVGEEFGEACEAWIGFTGQNPRKGITHDKEQVIDELLDTAISALVAAESLKGSSIWTPFYAKLILVARRIE